MILVLGSGRSGTSEVAEILEEMGVNMGHRFHLPDQFNPRGYFEDRDFQELNMVFTMMGLDKSDNEQLWGLWRERFNRMVATREEPWGVKDPGIADFPKLLEEYMKLDPQVIVCTRDKEDTLNSLKRFKNITRDKAEHIYDNRLKNIKAMVKEYKEIDCYAKDKEKQLKSLLKV